MKFSYEKEHQEIFNDKKQIIGYFIRNCNCDRKDKSS